jgi:hypothetical protein
MICTDELDLSLLAVCRRTRALLEQHPVARTIRAFCTRRRMEKTTSLDLNQSGTTTNLSSSNLPDWPLLPSPKDEMRLDVIDRPWCTAAFLWKLQMSFLKHSLRTYWVPYLLRDRAVSCRVSSDPMDQIDRLCQTFSTSSVSSGASCGTNDSCTLYPWASVYVWPAEGRIVIRDRLMNRCSEIVVPLLKDVVAFMDAAESRVSMRSIQCVA